MFRVYIGNLDSNVTEDGLKQLLEEMCLSFRSVVIKRSYAFVDCIDQENFEQALEKLNGLYFFGANLLAEPAAISKRIRSDDLVVYNLPPNCDEEEIKCLLTDFGPISSFNISSDEDSTTVNVVYESSEDAKNALTELNTAEYKGRTIKVEYHDTRTSFAVVPRTRHQEYPLRMLVPSEYIGAVIGRRGQTIKRITTNCNVKVDVHGKENTGFQEKLVSIFGSPESCTEACGEIMSIIQQSVLASETGEVPLKLLVDDLYCGRIIGRDGRGIKKIREETGSRIAISNVQEMAVLYPDRVISIRGSLDSMAQAESAISEKLRDCYKKEEFYYAKTATSLGATSRLPSTSAGQRSAPGSIAQAPSPPSRLHRESPLRYSSPPPSHHRIASAPTTPTTGAAAAPITTPPSSAGQQHSVCQVAIPNFAVGAVIGAGGVNIKRIIRDSNALVTVEPRRDDQSPSDERIATIKGSPDSCWRATYFIFEKMKQEGFAGSDGEVRLRTIITIPRSAAGRVVGKSGKSVREIQRITGAMIKLAADVRRESQQQQQAQQQYESPSAFEQPATSFQQLLHHRQQPRFDHEDLVPVEIFGNFIATQSAQSRIRSIASKVSSSQQSSSEVTTYDFPSFPSSSPLPHSESS